MTGSKNAPPLPVSDDMIGAGMRVWARRHEPCWGSDEQVVVAIYTTMRARELKAEEESKRVWDGREKP